MGRLVHPSDDLHLDSIWGSPKPPGQVLDHLETSSFTSRGTEGRGLKTIRERESSSSLEIWFQQVISILGILC